MDEEPETIAVGFITGRIRLELKPPNGIAITPRIYVDAMETQVEREAGESQPTWKYLTVAEQGDHKVKLVLGHTIRDRSIVLHGGETRRLDFILGSTH